MSLNYPAWWYDQSTTEPQPALGVFWKAVVFGAPKMRSVMTAVAQLLAPGVGTGVGAPVMAATARMLAPTVTLGGTSPMVSAPVMAATARMLAPTVSLHSAPVYNNSAVSAFQNNVSSPASFSFSETIAANTYGIVCIEGGSGGFNMNDPGGATAATVTFGGVTLTSLGFVNLNNTGTDGWAWVFGGDLSSLVAGTYTVAVTVTQAGSSFNGWAHSHTFTNVGSVGTLQTAFGNGTSPSVSVPSAAGRRVWGCVTAKDAFATPSAFSLTQRQSQVVNFDPPAFVAGDAAGAPTVTVSATIGSETWGVVGLDLRGT
jgi:hypothetical protein